MALPEKQEAVAHTLTQLAKEGHAVLAPWLRMLKGRCKPLLVWHYVTPRLLPID